MSEGPQTLEIESIPLPEIATPTARLPDLCPNQPRQPAGCRPRRPHSGQGRAPSWSSPERQISPIGWCSKAKFRAERPEPDGTSTTVGFAHPGDGFGEAPLLTAKTLPPFLIPYCRRYTC